MTDAPAIADRPLHHVGYVVDDLADGIARFAALGAGPFLELGTVALETCTFEGRPARFEHRVAFGQWGPIAVELQCVDAVEPASFGELMGRPGRIGHVAWVVDDLEAEVARLEGLGIPSFHRGGAGPISVSYHWSSLLGHAIEVHRRNAALEGLFTRVREAAG